jgi:hypothetical protein
MSSFFQVTFIFYFIFIYIIFFSNSKINYSRFKNIALFSILGCLSKSQIINYLILLIYLLIATYFNSFNPIFLSYLHSKKDIN